MNNIWEIIIIVLAGLGSIAFIIRYFFFASRKHGCNSCTTCREEILRKIREIDSAEKNKANG